MKKQAPTAYDQLIAAKVRQGRTGNLNRRLKFVVGVAAGTVVGFVGLCVLATTTTQTPTPVGPDWRTKVGQATPAELADQPKLAKPVVEETSQAQPQTQSDPLAEWAMRAHAAEQAQQNRCWDQLETRGYGDAACY